MSVAERITYREYQPADYQQMIGVLAVTDLLDVRRDTPDIYNTMIAGRPGSIQVAEYTPDQRVVACCLSDMPHPIIGSLAVHPMFQGKGVGTELLERMITYLGSEGHSYAELLISLTDRDLLRFYRKCGFAVSDKCVLMERPITPGISPLYRGANIDRIRPSQAFDVIYKAPGSDTAAVNLFVEPILAIVGVGSEDIREKAPVSIIPRQAFTTQEEPDTHPLWGRVILANQQGRPEIIHSVWPHDLTHGIPPHYSTTIVKKADGEIVGVTGTRGGKKLSDNYHLHGLLGLLREDAQLLLRAQGGQEIESVALSRQT